MADSEPLRSSPVAAPVETAAEAGPASTGQPAATGQTERPARTARPPRRRRALVFVAVLVTVLLLLFGVPALTLLYPAARWPAPVEWTGTGLFALAVAALPTLMFFGHGRRGVDRAARTGDTILGAIWVLFSWSVLGNVARLILAAAGVTDPVRSRIVAIAVLAVAAVLLPWGYVEAMRVPRVRRVDVTIPRLGAGLSGTRVVLLCDTHYGPIDRARWSRGVATAVNELAPDVICHAGDIADGTVTRRREQAAPLGTMRASLAKVYVTGNHEYFGEAQDWLDHMTELGWESLHNRHVVVERGGDRLVLAGIDDATARHSGLAGHGADIAHALAGVDPNLPVLLVAHQPKQVGQVVGAGVDLQVSGHTHGGQIWPFNFLVRTDQPLVQGLRGFGTRTQLYTSRGTGFWGPPFRIFAPSEITLITLRAPHRPSGAAGGAAS